MISECMKGGQPMKAKQFLNRIKKLDALIQNKLIEAEQWKAVALGTTANAEGERVQSSGDKQKMADSINQYIDIQREIIRSIDDLVAAKYEVIGLIEQLPTQEYDLLHKVYVQGLSFQETAEKMNRSYSWVAAVHGRALLNVQRIMDGRERK